MIELCKYIYENYPGLKDKIEFWQLLSLLDRNDNKIVIVKENDKFKGAALYMRITDETLEDLKLISQHGTVEEIKSILGTPATISKILQEDGDNIHFLFVLADSFKIIREGLCKVIKKEHPKNVSWFNVNSYRMKVFKGDKILCKV